MTPASEGPSRTPDSHQACAIIPYLEAEVGVYSAHARLLSSDEEAATRYEPGKLTKILPYADKGVVYWVSRTKEAVEELLIGDRGGIQKETIQKLSFQEAKDFFNELPDAAKWAILHACLRVKKGAGAQLIHTKKELQQDEIELVEEGMFEVDIDVERLPEGTKRLSLAEINDALFLSTRSFQGSAKDDFLKLLRRSKGKDRERDYMPLLKVLSGGKVKVLIFLSCLIYDKVLAALENDRTTTNQWLRSFVMFHLREQKALAEGDQLQAC